MAIINPNLHTFARQFFSRLIFYFYFYFFTFFPTPPQGGGAVLVVICAREHDHKLLGTAKMDLSPRVSAAGAAGLGTTSANAMQCCKVDGYRVLRQIIVAAPKGSWRREALSIR